MLAWKSGSKARGAVGKQLRGTDGDSKQTANSANSNTTSVAQTVDPNPIYRLENLGTNFGTV